MISPKNSTAVTDTMIAVSGLASLWAVEGGGYCPFVCPAVGSLVPLGALVVLVENTKRLREDGVKLSARPQFLTPAVYLPMKETCLSRKSGSASMAQALQRSSVTRRKCWFSMTGSTC